MDFPVEATVAVACFPDETAVLTLLRSHGFQLKDLGGGQVRVRGSFQKLRAVKVRLEQLVPAGPRSSCPVPAVSPGAISKYYISDGAGSRSTAQPALSSPSSSSSSASRGSRAASPPDPGLALVVDPDVFRYAERLRSKDLAAILHLVRVTVQEGGGSTCITLQGKNSQMAAGNLQRLFHDLSQSLRTQEVPLRDARHHGAPLLDRIRKNHNVLGPVLVCEKDDGLHLVGPSKESYELKQRLLGRPADQSGSRGRSRSLPPANRRSPGIGGGAAGNGQQGAAGPGQNRPPRRRSLSGSRQQEKKSSGVMNGPLKFFKKRFGRRSVQQKPDGRKSEGNQSGEIL